MNSIAHVMDDVIIPIACSANYLKIASKTTITLVSTAFLLSALGIKDSQTAFALPVSTSDFSSTDFSIAETFTAQSSESPFRPDATYSSADNASNHTSSNIEFSTSENVHLERAALTSASPIDIAATNNQFSVSHTDLVLETCDSADSSCDRSSPPFVPITVSDSDLQNSEIQFSEASSDASQDLITETHVTSEPQTDPAVEFASPIAQVEEQDSSQAPSENPTANVPAVEALGSPFIRLQGVYLQEGDEASARARVTGTYAPNPSLLFGITVDAVTGDAFTDSEENGIDLNELYVAASPADLPGLRAVFGMIDLTSYFDRNSFAKDAATQFFNPVFQTNPALSATGIGSRPGALVTWNPIDNVSLTGAAFSSDRDIDEFSLDGFAGEVGVRFGNVIVRGTYATDRDAGQNDGFNEIYQIARNGGEDYGLTDGDREVAYGLNVEAFIPEISLGLFGRYGWYDNRTIDQGGQTYSLGFNLLDLLLPNDRLGLGYGRELSNHSLRRRREEVPDVWELFYDARLTRNLRAGVSLQARDQFSETVLGFRVRAEIDSDEIVRLFR